MLANLEPHGFMLSYESLDLLADSVNPALLVASLSMPAWHARIKALGWLRWLSGIAAAAIVVYALQFADAYFGIWKAFGADYSTHTAFVVALIAPWSRASWQVLAAGVALVAGYAVLMVHQEYHSWTDILSSAIVVAPLAWLASAGFQRSKNA